MLEIQDLTCGYEKDKPLVRYVNCRVVEGKIYSILGPNGCGKTTFLKTIVGLLPPLEGAVLFDGENIARWSPARFATVAAYVPQIHTPPFPYTVKDLVMLGRMGRMGGSAHPTQRDHFIVENALELLGISHLRSELYTDISGGELQLVLIARAIAQEPRLLVLDEPTASLDYGNAVRVIKRIRVLADEGYAVVMTTHSPDHAFMCHSDVLLLQPGFPMRSGSAFDVITEKNMRQAYGVTTKIVEFVDSHNEIMRKCAPIF